MVKLYRCFFISLETSIHQQRGDCAILREGLIQAVSCDNRRYVTCYRNGKYILCDPKKHLKIGCGVLKKQEIKQFVTYNYFTRSFGADYLLISFRN